jgi:hypothetical protein
VSSNLGSLYTVSARNASNAPWVPAVIGTSNSQYSYTITQSNVYQPSVYFKLIRPSGVEMHKDSGDTTTSVGIAPVGEYTLTGGVSPDLFTKEGLATPYSGTATLTFPKPPSVNRILFTGTQAFVNGVQLNANSETSVSFSASTTIFRCENLTHVTRILFFNNRGLVTPRLRTLIPTGNYWVSNTTSSNVLVTPPIFGWTFPLANVTGYTITSLNSLPYKLKVSSGSTVLDEWANINGQTYTALFPAPRQLNSLGCNVIELVDTTTIDCQLRLILYSNTLTQSTTIQTNIYGQPVFCTVSGPSVPSGSRTVISNLQTGTDITTFDFGANVVNIQTITYSTLTTNENTPGLLRTLGQSVSVVGRLDTEPNATFRGRMFHPNVNSGAWNGVQWNQQFELSNPSSLQLYGQSDLFPFSQVGIQLSGTLTYSVIHSLTYRFQGHLYAYRLENISAQDIVNGVSGSTPTNATINGISYTRITIQFRHSISQIQIYGITVTIPSPGVAKSTWDIWCRNGEKLGIVTSEGAGTPTNQPGTVTDVEPPTQPPFSNIFGVRMTRTGPCHFTNITLYNDLGAAVNTNDERGRGFQFISFAPATPVQFKSYSFVSDTPLISWVLKNGSTTIDSVLVNSEKVVYRELSTIHTSGTLALEISNAVGHARISDFKLYSDSYQMLTSNALAPTLYGSALAGKYAISASHSESYVDELMPFTLQYYTRVSGQLVQGPWIQIEMPIPIVVAKCFFYGNHRLYTLVQSNDGASWTLVCSGDADVYREINPLGARSKFFRFICQSVYGVQWNVDIALCNINGERLNAKHASGYITVPTYFGGLATSSPQTNTYTLPSSLSNIYFRNTNVSNVIIGGRKTTMTVVADGIRQFTPSAPLPQGSVQIIIDGIDSGKTVSFSDFELLDATHTPMIYRSNVMISTVPQGYYEFSGNRIRFPIAVTPKYSNISGELSGTSTIQYTLQNTNEVLYDAQFRRLTPVTRSNGFVRDIVYSGSNAVTQRQFLYFDAGTSKTANSYTFTCDPPPVHWTLQCNNVVVHSQTIPNWNTSTTYTSLINNGCVGQKFTLSIDTIQSTTSNTLRISSFGVYNDQGALLTPQFTSNTTTATRFYSSTQAKGYFEVTPESQWDFVFKGAQSIYTGDIIVRLPCFVRISGCRLAIGSAEFDVSSNGTEWVSPTTSIMALYIRIRKGSGLGSGLSVFINSTQCII